MFAKFCFPKILSTGGGVGGGVRTFNFSQGGCKDGKIKIYEPVEKFLTTRICPLAVILFWCPGHTP
jgi:hypothetical protein